MAKEQTYLYNLGLQFGEVSRTHANKEAIVSESGKSISFDALNKLSNQIARLLLKQGVKTGDVICLFNSKSVNGFASMLACLKTGAAYVNLDHTSPFERLKKIIDRCAPKLILNDFGTQVDTKAYNIPVIVINGDEFSNSVLKEENTALEITQHIVGTTPAYIMFTSGSTGFPKGAVMTHANILNFISWGKQQYEVTPADRFTNVNPVYFDNSVFDFYVSLFNGASLLPLTPETVKEPRLLVAKINELKPSVWFSVPSMLVFLLTTRALTKIDFKSLRVITFGGEGFPKAKLKLLYDLYNDHVRFVNVYGPTECTCICSAYDISEKDFSDMTGIPPLGNLIANFSHIIWNEDTNATDTFGELCLIGPQVGLGYYNDPDRTANAFIQNPVNKLYKEFMYKTGDLVKRGEDGYLYFSGRKDNQIKHMGYRVELEEIEAAFNSLPHVKESCVVYTKNASGLGQIIAYLASTAEVLQIQNEIKQLVPSYMLPRQIHVMDVLPKNKNGKIDRQELMHRVGVY